MLALGAGVHERLRDDGQRGVHHFGHVDVEDEVGILQNVHPEAQGEAAAEGGNDSTGSISATLIYQMMPHV